MYVLIGTLLRPYTFTMLALAAGVVLLWRRGGVPRWRRVVPTACYAVLWVLSMPVTGLFLSWTLERGYDRLDRRPTDAQAIVVLSGGVIYVDDVHWHLAIDSLMRSLHGAELYRSGPPCPVVTSGGKVDPLNEPGPPYAQVMADFLRTQGVRAEDIVVEPRSRTTYENAVECARLLNERGIRRVVLVTDATHLARAALCFRRQGVDVVPSSCQYTLRTWKLSFGSFLPDPFAPGNCQVVFHEYLGLAWYWLTGKV
ncbi:MAG: YdcF family protein [Isosphaeraceae bacterium]